MYLVRHLFGLLQLLSIVRAGYMFNEILESSSTLLIKPDECAKINYRKESQALAADTTDFKFNTVLFIETNFGVAGCHISQTMLDTMAEQVRQHPPDWKLGNRYPEISRGIILDLTTILDHWASARPEHTDNAPDPTLRAPPLLITAAQFACGYKGQNPYTPVVIRQLAKDIEKVLKGYDSKLESKHVGLLSTANHRRAGVKYGAAVCQEDLTLNWRSGTNPLYS